MTAKKPETTAKAQFCRFGVLRVFVAASDASRYIGGVGLGLGAGSDFGNDVEFFANSLHKKVAGNDEIVLQIGCRNYRLETVYEINFCCQEFGADRQASVLWLLKTVFVFFWHRCWSSKSRFSKHVRVNGDLRF